MRRLLISSLVLTIAVLCMTQSARAARIYNWLPITAAIETFTVGVPHPGKALLIDSRQRSESINWKGTNSISVSSTAGSFYGIPMRHVRLCYVDFGWKAELVGGNYMTIGYSGDQIICYVCDSNHNRIASDHRNQDSWWRDVLRVSRSPEHGRSGC